MLEVIQKGGIDAGDVQRGGRDRWSSVRRGIRRQEVGRAGRRKKGKKQGRKEESKE